MIRILDYIEIKNRKFQSRSIFTWLKNTEIELETRFAFAPYMAHFVFSFMDINRFILRDLTCTDKLQELVNIHTEEDANHWPWYLQDIKKLNFDKSVKFSEALLFLWSDHCVKSRMITYEMVGIIKNSSPLEKVILIEVIEKTGNVFLSHTADVCREAGRQNDYLYYGDNHLANETGHHLGTQDIEARLKAIILTEEEVRQGIGLVDRTYALYHDFVDEMYDFAASGKLLK